MTIRNIRVTLSMAEIDYEKLCFLAYQRHNAPSAEAYNLVHAALTEQLATNTSLGLAFAQDRDRRTGMVRLPESK